jgi:ABC-type sugar transport system ATPase subunit
VLIEGKLATIGGPADAVRYGIGLVPEDRKQHGLVLMMDVKANTSMAMLQRLSNLLGKINGRREQEVANRYVKMLSVATPSINQIARNLSGGNQQKVVLAKWLSTEPKILIMDEPTRGIDVGAKAEVHALMSRLAQQGMGIIMISSEMPEIIGMSDRVIVMCQGRVSGEFERADFSQEEIMVAATRFLSLDAAPVETTDPPEASEEPAQSLSEPSH